MKALPAKASFVDANTVHVTYSNGQGFRDVNAETIVIAVGTSASVGDHGQSDNGCIFTSDQILSLDALPRTLSVNGGGVIGCEYATIFAALGVRVTLIDARDRLLPFVDAEIMDALVYEMRQNRITLRLGQAVSAVEPFVDDRGPKVRLRLESGKQIVSEKALYSIGRTGATQGLALKAAGLEADNRGRVDVNEHYQTAVPNI
ncbi:MAG: FAD-dependent oxidoreductase [Alphaproteobacteria bacterium]